MLADPSKNSRDIWEENLRIPVGPAAGPHYTACTRTLWQAYYAGARFFELKTVQKMDGPELFRMYSETMHRSRG